MVSCSNLLYGNISISECVLKNTEDVVFKFSACFQRLARHRKVLVFVTRNE